MGRHRRFYGRTILTKQAPAGGVLPGPGRAGWRAGAVVIPTQLTILELELGLRSIRRRRRLLLRANILEEDAAVGEVALDQAAAVVCRLCAVHDRRIRTAARVVSAMIPPVSAPAPMRRKPTVVTVAEVEREVSMTAAEAMRAEVTTDVDVMPTDVTTDMDVMATAVMTDVDVDMMVAVVAGVMAGVVAATMMTTTVATGRSGCGHEDGGSDRSSGCKREHRDTIQHGEGPSGLGLVQVPPTGPCRRVCTAYFAHARATVSFVTRVTAFLRMLKNKNPATGVAWRFLPLVAGTPARLAPLRRIVPEMIQTFRKCSNRISSVRHAAAEWLQQNRPRQAETSCRGLGDMDGTLTARAGRSGIHFRFPAPRRLRGVLHCADRSWGCALCTRPPAAERSAAGVGSPDAAAASPG
jgi:hypothetical protein